MVWQPADTSPTYRAAIWDPHAKVDAHLEVIDEAGDVLARIGGDPNRPGAVSGQVNLRGDEHVRFTGQVTLRDDDLIPRNPGDLLHPLTRNRVRVWWDILVLGGVWESVPLGTGYIMVDPTTDDGAPAVDLTLRLADAFGLVKQARMEMSVEVGGMTVDQAIAQILTADCPWLELDLTPSSHRLPADYEAGEPDADPVGVCVELAAVAGMRLYVDRMGVAVLEDDVDGATVRSAFVEGPGCKATRVTTSTDLSQIRNEVTVTTGAMKDPDGNDLEPLTVTVADEDPSSWTRVDRGYVAREPVITADEATTTEQLRAIAEAKLAELSTPVREVEVEHFPHPHLDPGDAVEVGFDRLGLAGVQRIRSWSLALGEFGWQDTLTEGRR